jgi:phosphoribosylglycinamide formyltransferase-1
MSAVDLPGRPIKRIVILISGNGSNMQAVIEAAAREDWLGRLGARVVAVISNKPEAAGLGLAQQAGIDRYAPALVLLAGFMRILTPGFVRHYAGRLVNIHPSLLPAFPGLHTHRRAIEAGCAQAGATVHWVTPELDHGPILAQAAVPVLPGDTEQTLAARVLEQEHRIYPQAVRQLLINLY